MTFRKAMFKWVFTATGRLPGDGDEFEPTDITTLVRGPKGLQVVEENKFLDRQIPFSETYSGIMAVRFVWSYGEGLIAPQRLCRSLRLLLDHPDVVDLIIADLARWQDWDVQDRLLTMYGSGEFDYPAAKRAIIRFLIASRMKGQGQPVDRQPVHAQSAAIHLKRLRTREPKLVADAEKFFFLAGPSSSAAESNVAKGRP